MKRLVLYLAVALVAAASPVFAGTWTVTNLHPAGATSSSAEATSGTQQAGFEDVSGIDHACTGRARRRAGWTSIHRGNKLPRLRHMRHPAGGLRHGRRSPGVRLLLHSRRHLVGYCGGSGDLNPTGSIQSFALATSGFQQAGHASIGGCFHAGVWSGTAASWVDLNPAGAVFSYAYATSGTQQAGCAAIGGQLLAGIWSGTVRVGWISIPAEQAAPLPMLHRAPNRRATPA